MDDGAHILVVIAGGDWRPGGAKECGVAAHGGQARQLQAVKHGVGIVGGGSAGQEE
jgi:hypothetical protein